MTASAMICTSVEQRDGIAAALRAGLSPLTVDPPIRLNEWMREHFKMSEESSHGRAEWTPYPFQIALADWMDDRAIEALDIMKSARVGYTKLLTGYIGYNAEHRRVNTGVWQPTDDDRDSFVKTEIDPMLRDAKGMERVFPGFMAKSKENTMLMKKYIGSVLHTLGAKAAKNFRRITLGVAILDEVDGMDLQVEGSGTPDGLAWKRTEGALHRKMVCGSTPRSKGLSHIERRCNAADVQMRCHIICRHCGLDHPLIAGDGKTDHGLKWDKRAPHTVRHVCPHCKGSITQADYLAQWNTWVWVSRCGTYRYGTDRVWRLHTGERVRAPRRVAAHIWTAYSPQATWEEIAQERINAAAAARIGNKGPLIGHINETLGEPYEDTDADKMEGADLAQRAAREAKPYAPYHAPYGCTVVVAATDTQDNRWETQFIGRGRNDETWVLGYKVTFGNPALEEEWDRMHNEIIGQLIQHESGAAIKAEAHVVDTGGHFSHQAYAYCRKYGRQRVYAIRGNPKDGQSIKGRPTSVDINYRGKIIKAGVKLWYVGTDTAKDLIYGRLTKVNTPGAGYIHFCTGLPDEYYKGLTLERRLPVKTARGLTTRWVNPSHGRNEPWDTMVYAEFGFHMLDLPRYNDAMWKRREEVLQPSLFGAAEQTEPAKPEPLAALVQPPPPPRTRPTTKSRRPGGFATNW